MLEKRAFFGSALLIIFLISNYLVQAEDILGVVTRWDSSYHYHSDSQFDSGKNAIDALALKGTERILDVGCGTGRTTEYCAKKLTTGTVVGIDACAEMIVFAQKQYAGNTKVIFQACDVSELRFRQEFDLVYSFFCLHWVSNPKRAIQKIAQSLKPSGRAVIYVSYDSLLARNWDQITQRLIAKHPEWKEHCSMYACLRPLPVWNQWCRDAGLELTAHKDDCSTRFFSTFDDTYLQLSVLEIATKLPAQEREQFLTQMITELYAVANTKLGEPLKYFTCSLRMELKKSKSISLDAAV